MADMCPYCGDELAPKALTCGRCGMDLDGGGAEVPPPPETASDTEGAAKIADGTPCPHCGEPNKKSAHRCTACGRAIERLMGDDVHAENLKFKLYVYGGIAAAVILFVGLILLGGC